MNRSVEAPGDRFRVVSEQQERMLDIFDAVFWLTCQCDEAQDMVCSLFECWVRHGKLASLPVLAWSHDGTLMADGEPVKDWLSNASAARFFLCQICALCAIPGSR